MRPEISNQADLSLASGWKSIDVYYGKPEVSKRVFNAQVNQDKIVLSLLSKDGTIAVESATSDQTNGFFIDLAANDALYLSNTYALETYYGWKGLCFEPNPKYWYKHAMYRPNCKTIGGIVFGNKILKSDEVASKVQFRFDKGSLGGIVGSTMDNKESEKNVLKVEQHTVSFLSVLRRYNAPKLVDYLSLDVEGAEGYILDDDFPFDEYTFKILTVERPKITLRNRLMKNGYKMLGIISGWGETIWIHSKFENDLNINVIRPYFRNVTLNE